MTDPIAFDLAAAKEFPVFRFYIRSPGSTSWQRRYSFGQWEMDPKTGENLQSPTPPSTIPRPGMIVEHISRCLFPGIGQAIVSVPFGTINGKRYTLGTDWDLVGHELRIDCVTDGGDELSDDDYRTVWWGVIERQSDTIPPAADTYDTGIGEDPRSSGQPTKDAVAGTRVFIAYDPLYHLSRRPILSHKFEEGLETQSGVIRTCYGPIGFNVDAGGGRSPNRGYTGADNIYPHCMPGAVFAEYWTDIEALTTTLDGIDLVVDITIDDPKSILSQSVGHWPVNHGDTPHEVFSMILDRSRGLGCAFFDWDGDTVDDDTSGMLRIYPQNVDDVTIPGIAGSSEAATAYTISGASSATATTQTIVLTGDQRVDSNRFSLGEENELTFDRVETWGECVRVLATLGVPDGSLARGWSAAQQTDFDAASTDDEADLPEFAAVYRLLRIAGDWNCATNVEVEIATGDDPETVRIDYRCRDDGTILSPAAGDPEDTSPGSLRLTASLPCPADVDPYDGTSISGQAATGGVLKYQFYQRNGDNDLETWTPSGADTQVTPSFGAQHIVFNPTSNQGADRTTEDMWEKIMATVGVILPHRVRMATTGANASQPPKRVQTIRIPGAHLWLGHRNSVVGINSGTTPKRIRYTAPLIYRDDRNMLRQRHALACKWFLTPRRTLQYTIRSACGLLPSFEDENSDAQPHPKLGHVVTTVNVAGDDYTVNTVVSRISYDQGNTTFVTDWHDLR